jgi:hypothetical protein
MEETVLSQPITASATELTKAVSQANSDSSDLDKAAVQLVEQIGMPVFREALAKQPELKQLKAATAVDLISSSLAMDLFADAGPNEDVIVQLPNGYVTVPATQREVLQSGIIRTLVGRTSEIEQLLAKGH